MSDVARAQERLDQATWMAAELARVWAMPLKKPLLVRGGIDRFYGCMVGRAPIDYRLASVLDDDELLFCVLMSVAAARGAVEMRPTLRNPLRGESWVALYWAVVLLASALLTPPPWVLMTTEVVTMFAAMWLLWPAMQRMTHQAFELASRLTGMPEAGERYGRKYAELPVPLSRLSPLFAHWTRRVTYEMTVPPEWRRPLPML